MIAYHQRALAALTRLFRPYNDVDVYVEDCAKRNLYEVLLNRILAGHAKVTRVFQLGGREEVIKACEADQEPGGRPRLYIIDGDLDLLAGRPAPQLAYSYRLKVYCSENLVFCGTACVQVAIESLSNTPPSEVAARIAFDQFVESIDAPLVDLFCSYAAVHFTDSEVPTVGLSVMDLCIAQAGGPSLSAEKVKGRVRSLVADIDARNSRAKYDQELAASIERLPATSSARLGLCSGKAYLLPLLYHHLRRVAAYRGPMEELTVRLARYASLDIDPGLADAMRAASRAFLL